MKPLRNYVLLTFLRDEEEVVGGLIIAGSKAVQRARVLDCGQDVSLAVRGAYTVVLRKNNTAVQVSHARRDTYLVQETDILAVEQTMEEKMLMELHGELEDLHKQIETMRSPPPEDYILDNEQPSAIQDPGGELPPLDVIHPDEFGGSDFPENFIPAQAETDPEDEKEQ